MDAIGSADFRVAQAPPPLGDAEIHLWLFPQWDMRARASAQSRPLRVLLAAYLDCVPDMLRIERGEYGKPQLVGAALEFNLAHSGGSMLVALSRHVPLGVDLEAPRRTRPVLELARRWFHPDEATALAALPEALQQSAFLRLWTCKEAVLKAHGRGLGFGLDRVAFALDARGEVTSICLQADAATAWQVRKLAPAAGFYGALAWRGPDCPVRALIAPVAPEGIAAAAQSG